MDITVESAVIPLRSPRQEGALFISGLQQNSNVPSQLSQGNRDSIGSTFAQAQTHNCAPNSIGAFNSQRSQKNSKGNISHGRSGEPPRDGSLLEAIAQQYLFQLQEEVLSGAPFAKRPEEPLTGRAHTNFGLQQEADRLLHLGDHQIYCCGHEQHFV